MAESKEERLHREHVRKLRAALDGVAYVPEVTEDDRPDDDTAEAIARDEDFKVNRPPHHG